LALCSAETLELPFASPEFVGIAEEKLSQVDATLEKLVQDAELAGVVVIAARKGRVFYHKAFGNQDIESNVPMQSDSIFRIHSFTKAIASAAAMTLYEQGKFELEDPVGEYIPSFANFSVIDGESTRPAKTQMKVIDLLRHTSGLGSPGKFSKRWSAARKLNPNPTLAEYVEMLSQLPLHEEPSTVWRYGASTNVVARLVEIWSGEPYQDYLQKNIFDPLGMVDTGFMVPEDKVDRFATSYNKSEEGILSVRDEPSKSRYLVLPKLFQGQSGLCSTTADFMRFLLMIERGGTLFGHPFLKRETIELMLRNHVPDELLPILVAEQRPKRLGFGLGFYIPVNPESEWRPRAAKDEFGWGGNASSHYWASREHELCVITMEQTVPFSFLTEDRIKGLFYDAILD